jgi:hypothetical protein
MADAADSPLGITAIQTFSVAFASSLAELRASLEAEGGMLERCRALLAAARALALELERAREGSLLDGAMIVSLRQRLAASEGAGEAARVREAQAREELARERCALRAAGARIAALVGEGEALRQTLAAAPRPARPVLLLGSGGAGAGGALPRAAPADAASPFEQWRASKLLVRLDSCAPRSSSVGGSGSAGLSVAQVHALGHAIAGERCSGGGGGGGGGEGQRASTLGKGPLELVEHAFWSPHLYAPPSAALLASLPPPPPQQQQPAAQAPQRLLPLSLTHVSNIARHGGAEDRWGQEMDAERARLAATLAAIKLREARVAALQK